MESGASTSTRMLRSFARFGERAARRVDRSLLDMARPASMHLSRLVLAVVLALFATAKNADAQQATGQLSASRFEAFGGDINGDGRMDLLMRARPLLTFTQFDDILIPILAKPTYGTFMVRSVGSSGFELVANPTPAEVRSSVWQAGRFAVSSGNVLADSRGSIFARSAVPGAASFSISVNAQSTALQLLQVVDAQLAGRDLGLSGTVTNLVDKNGDGRSDLVIAVDGLAADVLIANSSGQFVRDDDASILAVWVGMKSALESGDANTVLRYVAATSRPKYDEALAELAGTLSGATAGWQTPRSLTISATSAEYAVAHATNGGQRTVIVTFVREENMWRIEGF